MKKNIRKTAIIILIIFIGYLILDSIITITKIPNQDLPITYVLPITYESLIDTDYFKNIKVLNVFNSKIRNPVAICRYDEKYSLVIYQINNLQIGLNVKDLANISFKEVGDDFYGSFNVYGRDTTLLYGFQVNSNPIEKKSKVIYANLYGDSLQKISDEKNIVCYTIKLKNFYIKHPENRDVDIYVTTYEKSFFKQRNEIHSSILFINNNGNLFFLLMMPQNVNIKMPSDLLYKMVAK